MQACESAGLPAPEFVVFGNAVRITISRPAAPGKTEKRPRKRRPHKRDEALLAYLKEHPGVSLQQTADAFFVSVPTVWRFVQDMRNEGKL